MAQVKADTATGQGARSGSPENIQIYLALRRAARQVVFANPLLGFDKIVFVARGVVNDGAGGKSEYDGDHFCDQ